LKILTILGARPQFIKAATISRAIRTDSNIQELIVHTGQHFDKNMSDIFFDEMDIPKPDYNLAISSLSHGAMTGRMIEGIEKIIYDEKPDWVLVYGDTNSTLAGALSASKLHVKVAHVEAGLRSFNMKMPEEQNRIIVDRLSSALFCPSDAAIKNLKQEGYDNFGVQITKSGDVMYDAALFYSKRVKKPNFLNTLNIGNKFALATIHRAENTDNPLRIKEIFGALNEIHKKMPILVPIHPRTKEIIKNLDIKVDVHIIDPVGYLEMIYLLKFCKFVLSDSGGIQKEAYFFKKSCLILRDETEWTELVKHGANKLVGANKKEIILAAETLDKNIDYNTNFYGSGKSANHIINYLKNFEEEKSN
jgi:UDP-GlcNAc3NAcA epimerase